MGVAETAVKGDRRTTLEAVRDRLAEQLDKAEGSDCAPIAKQLRETLAELDKLPSGKEAEPLDLIADAVADELAARRADRATAGADPLRAGV